MNTISDFLMKDSFINPLLDGGYLPHSLIRIGIRRQLADRLSSISSTSLTSAYATKMKYVELLRTRPIAIETSTANEQHYEVGTEVLKGMLGPRMKYSACLYDLGNGEGGKNLEEAEVKMLECYVERAGLRDGMSVLDLGCGWGSLSIYLATKFPNSRITAFSNSRTQKAHIDALARTLSLTNLTVTTGDVVTYTFPASTYDRILSIELFEHMKNYTLLLAKLSSTLKPGGKLFVHHFAHRSTPYDFEDGWMTRHFFTGGTMPSADLLLYFQDDLRVQRVWWVDGRHYARTCEDWLGSMTMAGNEAGVKRGLKETYGEGEVQRWWNRWQVFYLACAELFAYEGGDTWGVCHYLFVKPE
ncbi:cyclopropane-fatty-acyl-phospholipid synthase-like protein [Lophiostoma macrostomum CBS 122681]|uniref:Cyclopropane-fatty-acyl-phospholipid synthase-like protein n=1 Tax=Lophiostoma macrostomum CBS 122681 TaxID=1314788 RepID=A0A6A6T4R9_9PLEO|nr:cyclopropane-fatty-acyl-phospholipid synthase-like protein [Lophiostoma macrostomum CBS 122681]